MRRLLLISAIFGLILLSSPAYAQEQEQSAAEIVQSALEQHGIQAAEEKYRELLADRDSYSFDENEFVDLSYNLLWAGRIDEAVAMLELNVETFPESTLYLIALADAYYMRGDYELSVRTFQKTWDIRQAQLLERDLNDPDISLAETAEEVIERHLEAIGGREKIEALITLQVTYKGELMGAEEITFFYRFKAPNLAWVGRPGSPYGTVTDGRDVWRLTEQGRHDQPENSTTRMMRHRPMIDNDFIHYLERGIEFELVGLEVVDFVVMYKVKKTYADGVSEDLYFDVQSNLLRVRKQYMQFGEAFRSFFQFSDEGGILMPHLEISTWGPGGRPPHVRWLKEVLINEPIDDSVFGLEQQAGR